MLDSAERLAKLAKQSIKDSLENSANTYHDLVRGFMDFHREGVGLSVAKSLFSRWRYKFVVLRENGGLSKA